VRALAPLAVAQAACSIERCAVQAQRRAYRSDGHYENGEVFHEIRQISPSFSGSARPKISCGFLGERDEDTDDVRFRSSSALRFVS
jgi:hypothetical protein